MAYQILIFLAIFGIVEFIREKLCLSYFVAPVAAAFSIISVLFITDLIFDDMAIVTTIIYVFSYACVIRWVLINKLYIKQSFLNYFSKLVLSKVKIFGFFISFCVFLYFLNINVKFNSWDEFTHWGTVIKYVSIKSTLYDINSPIAAKDYPPGTALFAYFMLFIPGYSEGRAIFSFSILTVMLILPLVGVAFRLTRYYWLFIAMALFGFVSKFGNGWSTVLIDHYVSMTFAMVVIVYFSYLNNKRNIFVIPIILFGYATFKDSAALFALFLGMYISLDLLIFKRYKYQEFSYLNTSSNLKVLAAMVVIAPIIALITWKLHLYFYQIQPTLGASNIDLLRRFASCCTSERELIVTKKFIEAYFGFGSDGLIFGIFRKNNFTPIVSYIFLLIPFMFLLKMEVKNRYRYAFLLSFILSVFVLYTLMNYLWYLYGFDDREGMGLASFKRYNDVTTLALTAISIWIFILVIEKLNIKYRIIFFVALMIFLLLPPYSVMKGISAIGGGHRIGYDKRRMPIHEVGVLLDKQLPKSSSVALAWQGSDSFEIWLLKYELLPRRTNIKSFEYCPSMIPVESKFDVPFACRLDLPEIKKRVSHFEYLYVAHGLSDLRDLYPGFYTGPANIDAALYKVIPDGDATNLIYLPLDH